MRDAISEHAVDSAWRELYRCDDLRQARAVAACIGAMEFDVRLSSKSEPDRIHEDDDLLTHRAGLTTRGICAVNHVDEGAVGPFVVEVHDSTWPQLADVLLEIIAEQQEFDQMLECRRDRHQARLVIVLSITTAVEVLLIWRMLEG